MASFSVPTLQERLNTIRSLSASELGLLFTRVNISTERLPMDYLGTLGDNDLTTAQRACLLCWAVTNGAQVPRELQLQACLATYNGYDSLINAGTGSGKTLPIALNLLLDNPEAGHISLTISPLKRLQITQENNFSTKYHIPTIAINEDTPREDAYWNDRIHNLTNQRGGTPGTARHIIATVEQLFRTPEGHFPRLAVLIRNKHFQKRIKRIHVDEAHFIHLAGLTRNGTKAFRPAWGQLDELKNILPNAIPWQAFSATFPPHILKTVTSKILRPNYVSISISSNRPNTIYATHCVTSSLEEPKNYECFLVSPFDFQSQPRVLIFFDSKALANNVAQHLNSRLPPELRNTGIIRHYHSGMSNRYLETVHAAFTKPDGRCKIMCATGGESVGVDFPDVKIVCNAGLPSDTVEILQRGGRVGRRDGDKGLFVIFYEAWVLDIDLDEFENGDLNDPDRSRKPLKPTSHKRDRAPYSLVKMVQCKKCLRFNFAMYLGDMAPNALDFNTELCCDRHEEEVFDLEEFLPSAIYTPSAPDLSLKRKKRPTYRRVCERAALDELIIAWLQDASKRDPLHGVRAMYDILSFKQRSVLVRAKAGSICTPSKLVELLEENDDWAGEWAISLLAVVVDYDKKLAAMKKKPANANIPSQKKSRACN